MDILFFQTADAFRYQPMLRATSRTMIEYCRRSDCLYESFTGLKRGFWPWQATFNRIVMFNELLHRGFRGWAIYADADAYITDLNFDIRTYLSSKSGYAAILVPSGSTDQSWDVNAGVCLLNTDHDVGRQLIAEWTRRFMSITDQTLRDAVTWMDSDNDQDLIQQMLRHNAAMMQCVYLQSPDLMNSSFATFIRQHLRQYTPDLALRLQLITQSVDRIIGKTEVDDGNDLVAGQKATDITANEIITAIYQALLEREPDAEGRHRALAGMQVRGIEDGLRDLARSIAGSVEFANLRTLR